MQPSSNSQLAFLEKNTAPCSSKLMACFPRVNKCNTLKQNKYSTLAESELEVFLQSSMRLINADPDWLTWEVICGLFMPPWRKIGAARESQYSQIHTNTKPCIIFAVDASGEGNSCAAYKFRTGSCPITCYSNRMRGWGNCFYIFEVKRFSLGEHFNRDFKNQQCPKQSPGTWSKFTW